MVVEFGADRTVDELILNHAQWHKSCHAELNANRLARARKRITPIKNSTEKPTKPDGFKKGVIAGPERARLWWTMVDFEEQYADPQG